MHRASYGFEFCVELEISRDKIPQIVREHTQKTEAEQFCTCSEVDDCDGLVTHYKKAPITTKVAATVQHLKCLWHLWNFWYHKNTQVLLHLQNFVLSLILK